MALDEAASQMTAGLKRHQRSKSLNQRVYDTNGGPGVNLYHISDDYGNHKLIVEEASTEEDLASSNWTPFEGIARAGRYAAVTEFYKGMLPPIFYIQPVTNEQSGEKWPTIREAQDETN